MDNCTQNIAIGFLFIIIIYLVINQKNMSKNKENFTLSSDDLTLVRTEINRIYDMDVEAIRNLGAISKSLLTGTNTFTPSTSGTPGDLNIPADNTILQGGLSLLNTTWEATKQDAATSHIVSDIGTNKSLMIVGNDSSGTRKVKLWDDVTVSNNLQIDGSVLTIASGAQITSPGRMHINGEENLFILNKNGVVIGKEWGGNGDLTVEGNQTNIGTLTVEGNITSNTGIIVPGISAPGRLNITSSELVHVYSKGGLYVGKTDGGSGDIIAEGNITSNIGINVPGISAPGRLNITCPELVHIYSKGGLYVGKTDGGSGDIVAEGNVVIHGNMTSNTGLTVPGISAPGVLNITCPEYVHIYSKKGLHVGTALGASGTITAEGSVLIHGNMTSNTGITVPGIGAPWRLNISCPELVHVYSKGGLYVGKTDGGSGSITAEGNVLIHGNIASNTGITVPGISAAWRLNITCPELVHVYSKGGLYVGKTDGGSGTIHAEGNISSPSLDRMNARIDKLIEVLGSIRGLPVVNQVSLGVQMGVLNAMAK